MAKKKPEQNDDWDRHAEQPQQNSASHGFLHPERDGGQTRDGNACSKRIHVPNNSRRNPAVSKITSDRCSASISTAPQGRAHRPFAAVRWNADQVNG